MGVLVPHRQYLHPLYLPCNCGLTLHPTLVCVFLPLDACQKQRPRTPLENTYKLEPDKKFEVKPVENLINEVLKQQVHGAHLVLSPCSPGWFAFAPTSLKSV